MGASKRLAELVVQGYAKQNLLSNNKLKFAIVRFGNVLGSSGSVVPFVHESNKIRRSDYFNSSKGREIFYDNF